ANRGASEDLSIVLYEDRSSQCGVVTQHGTDRSGCGDIPNPRGGVVTTRHNRSSIFAKSNRIPEWSAVPHGPGYRQPGLRIPDNDSVVETPRSHAPAVRTEGNGHHRTMMALQLPRHARIIRSDNPCEFIGGGDGNPRAVRT